MLTFLIMIDLNMSEISNVILKGEVLEYRFTPEPNNKTLYNQLL